MKKNIDYILSLFWRDKKLNEVRVIAILLFAVIVYQNNQVELLLSKQPVRLVPQFGAGPSFDTTVKSESNYEYVLSIYAGDIAMYMNYRHDTIVKRFSKLSYRFTDALIGRESARLSKFALDVQDGKTLSQTYYPESTRMQSLNNRLFGISHGTVIISDGMVPRDPERVVVAIEYSDVGGVPKIENILKAFLKEGDDPIAKGSILIGAKAQKIVSGSEEAQ